ncbi:uncharacterized protein PHACADRAFT_71216, partial [Phanerochaete carnosa HHB-10118-sp]
VRRGHFGCGKATPYDAEMAALARGLNEVVRDLPGSVTDIHVFADNQAALLSILAAGQGPAQGLSVAACQSVRPWLTASPAHHVHVWWCPGHRGVYWNGVVDKAAGLGAELLDEVSFAYARQCITADAYKVWRADIHRLPYRGRNNLMQVSDFERCKHTSANWFLRTAGRSTTYMARLIRFASGHFPHGAFRERFNFEGNRRCWCGADVETRDHIWFDCDLWIKKHKPPDAEIERMRWGERGDWRETPIALDDVAEFLRLNPIVGTFTWLELVDQALGDRARGEDDSLALLKVDLHTVRRKAAYE